MGCKSKNQKRKRQNLKRGKGLRFNDLTKTARSALKGKKFKNSGNAVKVAVKAIKSAKGKRRITPLRVIPVPKSGGFLPLIPIFAALGALGSLGGGATNKSEVTTWTGQLVRIEQTDFINNTIQIQKKQEGHVHYKQNSNLRTLSVWDGKVVTTNNTYITIKQKNTVQSTLAY
jgi:hypothetical protein